MNGFGFRIWLRSVVKYPVVLSLLLVLLLLLLLLVLVLLLVVVVVVRPVILPPVPAGHDRHAPCSSSS